MQVKWREHKITLGILTLLTLINGITFFSGFFERASDLDIRRVKESITEEGFEYEILLQSTQSIAQNAFVQAVDQKGVKQLSKWDLTDRKNWLSITTDKKLEYLAIHTPTTVSEVNVQNNRRFFDAWSPGIQVLASISTPEYDYIQDAVGNLWIVNAIRPHSGSTMGVYLTVLNPQGIKLVDQLLLSQADVTKANPVLHPTDQGVLILWTAEVEGEKRLQSVTYTLNAGKLQHQQTNTVRLKDGTFMKPLVAGGRSMDAGLFMLWEEDSSYGVSYYMVGEAGVIPVGDTALGIQGSLGGSIKQVLMFRDEEGNYLLYWLVKNHYDGFLYFAKISSDGMLRMAPRKIYTIPFRVNLPLSGVYQDGKLALFYTESFGALSWSTQIAYTIFNGEGGVIKERELIAPHPATEVTVAQDLQGNFNLIWSDKRRGGPRSSYDLFYQQLDGEYQQQIPTSILTDQEADLLTPKLRQLGEERYLTWREFHDGKYHLYVKSTHPQFGQQVRRADRRLTGRLLQVLTFIFHVIQRQSDKLIYLGFFNFFPLLALLGVVILLLSNSPMSNHLINWLLIYQVYFRLELMNIRYFQKMHLFEHLTVHDCDLIAGVIFLIIIGVFGLVNWQKLEPRMGKNSLLLLIWILLTGISMAVFNYLQIA